MEHSVAAHLLASSAKAGDVASNPTVEADRKFVRPIIWTRLPVCIGIPISSGAERTVNRPGMVEDTGTPTGNTDHRKAVYA